MSSPAPPPGWYADPDGGPGQRYWDGSAWGEHWRAQQAQRVPPPPQSPQGGSTVGKVVLGVVLGGVILIVGCGALLVAGGEGGSLTQDCVKNAFGAEFCGEEAESFCEEYGGPGCADIGLESTGRLEREADAEQGKLDREIKRDERKAAREQRKAERELKADEAEAEREQEELEREADQEQRRLERLGY